MLSHIVREHCMRCILLLDCGGIQLSLRSRVTHRLKRAEVPAAHRDGVLESRRRRSLRDLAFSTGIFQNSLASPRALTHCAVHRGYMSPGCAVRLPCLHTSLPVTNALPLLARVYGVGQQPSCSSRSHQTTSPFSCRWKKESIRWRL